MKPESRIEGRKKKKVICIACSWFCAMVEIVKPTQVGGDEESTAPPGRATSPASARRTQQRGDDHDRHWMKPITM